MKILESLDKLSKKDHTAVSFFLTLLVGVVDCLTGFKYLVTIFYLVPISYAAWFMGKIAGMIFSFLCIVVVLYSCFVSTESLSIFSVGSWNTMLYSSFFIIVALLLSKLRITTLERVIAMTKLQSALKAIKELSGILPICANCKKIRDEEGYWHDVEVYISRHTNMEFTHGICTECANKLYPSLFDKIAK